MTRVCKLRTKTLSRLKFIPDKFLGYVIEDSDVLLKSFCKNEKCHDRRSPKNMPTSSHLERQIDDSEKEFW